MRELAWHERHFMAFVVGGPPSLAIGVILGLWAGHFGGPAIDVSTVLQRGAYCAVFPTVLACLMPRSWILPALAYAMGFSFGHASLSNLGAAVLVLPEVFTAAIEKVTGEHHVISSRPELSHPDLPWIVAIGLWLGGLTSILRRSPRFASLIRRLYIQG